MSGPREEFLLHRLTEVAAEHTGFSTEAVSRDALARMVRDQLRKGTTIEQFFEECNKPSPWLLEFLRQAVLVGETFFFRHPEHFRFLANEAQALFKRSRTETLRCWSAGCSSGEEAYSLAACVIRQVPEGRPVEVLGTDLSEHRLAIAERGIYSSWSQRESGKILYPLFRQLPEGRVQVLDEVKAVTRFELHNLLEPPDRLGQFDIIFCRNVLVYFNRPAADMVRRYLARALSPGGYLVFGTMDVHRAPPGLVHVGQHGTQIFIRPRLEETRAEPESEAAQAASRPAATPPAAPAPEPAAPPPAKAAPPKAAARASAVAKPAPAPATSPAQELAAADNAADGGEWRDYIRVHTEALSMIERGQEKDAARALSELTRRAPDYLPGILQLALLHDRSGQQAHAQMLMKEVLRRAEALPPDQVLPGPEPLPVIFYETSARAFFERNGGMREG